MGTFHAQRALTPSQYRERTHHRPYHASTMSYNKDEKAVEEAATVQKIRITLTGTNVSDLENVCSQLITRAANSDAQKVKGPVRIPTKTLKITTRKTPNGEGSKTWDTYEMRIHKRVIDIWSPPALVKQVTSITLTSGIDIEITVAV